MKSSTQDSTDEISTLEQERQAQKDQAAAHMAQVAKDHPEADLASKGDWWLPAIDLTFDVKVHTILPCLTFLTCFVSNTSISATPNSTQGRLSPSTQAKLNASLQRIIDQKYAPEVVNQSLDEASGYLAGEQDLLDRFNGIFGNRQVWEVMRRREVEKDGEKVEGKKEEEEETTG